MKRHVPSPVVVLTGIDGTGKSSAASEAATKLSLEHPRINFNVVDSTGIRTFHGGVVISEAARYAEYLRTRHLSSAFGRAACTGAFTLARRHMERTGRIQHDPSLTISVRDPARIDPAAYASVLGPHILARLSIPERLVWLDRLTTLGLPAMVIHLVTDPEEALLRLEVRPKNDPHENIADLRVLQEDLTAAITSHEALFDVPYQTVEGLQPTTADAITTLVEPYIGRAAVAA